MDNHQFKDLLLQTLRILKDHPDAQNGGVGFVTEFDEEPEWEVILSFVPKSNRVEPTAPSTETLQ